MRMNALSKQELVEGKYLRGNERNYKTVKNN